MSKHAIFFAGFIVVYTLFRLVGRFCHSVILVASLICGPVTFVMTKEVKKVLLQTSARELGAITHILNYI